MSNLWCVGAARNVIGMIFKEHDQLNLEKKQLNIYLLEHPELPLEGYEWWASPPIGAGGSFGTLCRIKNSLDF